MESARENQARKGKRLIIRIQAVDFHNNGGFQIDYGQVKTVTDVLLALMAAVIGGAAKVVVTVITDDLDKMAATTRLILLARAESAFARRVIMGVFWEGPCLNVAGAHPIQHLQLPNRAVVDRLLEAAGDLPKMVCVAPELPDAIDMIAYATQQKVTVVLGHTVITDAALLDEAEEAGARLWGHVGNGMPEWLEEGTSEKPGPYLLQPPDRWGYHRHNHPVLLALGSRQLALMGIFDKVHIPRHLAQALAALGPHRCIATTDAAPYVGCKDGDYDSAFGGLPVTVTADAVRPRDRAGLAGSMATMQVVANTATEWELFGHQALAVSVWEAPHRILGVDAMTVPEGPFLELEDGRWNIIPATDLPHIPLPLCARK